MMKPPRIVSLPLATTAALYLCAYIFLEMITDIQSLSRYGVTSWHPAIGLTFLLALRYGRSALPICIVAALISALISQGDLALAATEAIIVGGGYGLAAMALRRPAIGFDVAFASLRDVFVLTAMAMASSAMISATYIALLLAESAELWATTLRNWVGDMVGIATVTPFGLLLLSRRRLVKPDWQAAVQVAIIVFALAVAVGSAEKERLQLFFLLFLPITWIAVSSGLEGVSMALMVTQVGLVAALHFIPGSAIDVMALQSRMLVLAVTGLVAGALVSEARRAEEKLRENQAAIARLSRLGSMGELAIAIAHEVNQPLSAAGTYSRLVTESLAGESLKDSSVVAMAKKATAQVERAADVIKRLRALVRLGRSELSPVGIELMIEEALDLVRPILERGAVTAELEIDKQLPAVMVDRIQIEQVLLNLLRNSAEAITSAAVNDRRILVQALRSGPEHAQITVSDSGPGFPEGMIGATPTLFWSNKTDGLGVGLSLCRSIVEAHGGALRLDGGSDGASVSFTLPFAAGGAHDR